MTSPLIHPLPTLTPNPTCNPRIPLMHALIPTLHPELPPSYAHIRGQKYHVLTQLTYHLLYIRLHLRATAFVGAAAAQRPFEAVGEGEGEGLR